MLNEESNKEVINKINRTKDTANQVKVVRALKEKHKRVEYRACLTRTQTLKTLDTLVTLVLHTTEKARLDFGSTQFKECTYESVRCGLLITDVVKGTTIRCDFSLNDDIEVTFFNLWPTAPLTSTNAEQVDPVATLTHS